MKLSVVIPAYNEARNLDATVTHLVKALEEAQIPREIVIVNDNSSDETPGLMASLQARFPEIVPVTRSLPRGFGRALRSGIMAASGDIIVPIMADASDDPHDVVQYYRIIKDQGYDCVYGSRFMPGSHVRDYPPLKLVINRIVNFMLQVLFWTPHNDLTNSFKAYRAELIKAIPLQACHFNITIEISLSLLIRSYKIARLPIRWYGRTWGQSNLKLKEMGRRYLATLLKIWFEKILILDDLQAESQARSASLLPSKETPPAP